jgi:aryl-alcohol dehydrogenase-like predicted oxidoreductase
VHKRTLDPGLRVSAIGQGCMGTSQTYGPNPGDRDTMTAVLRGAVNARVQGNRYDDHHMALMGC